MNDKIAIKCFLLLFLLAGRLWAADPILPDPKLTPGDVLTNVSVEQLCQRGYANVINGGVRDVPESVKRQVFIEYFGKVPEHPGGYEIDHLVSLELGGSNDIKNLWPETLGPVQWNAITKDRLEDRMAALVRAEYLKSGPVGAEQLLRIYQSWISTNWIAAYHLIFSESRNQGKTS
ncbi:MAG: HNH endonuclease [Patescibacteria group bacterium]|nr:HNH endonuclease [Patescibacteria group bacterium]